NDLFRSPGHTCYFSADCRGQPAAHRPKVQFAACEWIEDKTKRASCIESGVGLESAQEYCGSRPCNLMIISRICCANWAMPSTTRFRNQSGLPAQSPACVRMATTSS